ncbi:MULTISPECIES: hypothetical protein [unclassified Janthinobacterium]|uniref:hypothetical protein n=1 Tax=unclassified Janthinobacterium TaxID=2610881 RepID=UPI00161C2604|nr:MULTISPECIES: hypothetical protein [unclassified Janthinobacterium]MBB5607841.1 hypothetical protein [Janthinobacterium sp. S3T4]MBB5613010.1 hypothetical protein [Janthinobacterium sp. S3M3]
MAIDLNSSMSVGASRQQPELMLSAVLHLMSHYHAHSTDNGACPKLASVIERHLQVLSGLPDLAPVLQATCQQLSQQWATRVSLNLPTPPKTTFIERLGRMVGTKRPAASLPQ